MAERHTERRSGSELPRAVTRLEILVLARRRRASGNPAADSRIQAPAISLGERFNTVLDETRAPNSECAQCNAPSTRAGTVTSLRIFDESADAAAVGRPRAAAYRGRTISRCVNVSQSLHLRTGGSIRAVATRVISGLENTSQVFSRIGSSGHWARAEQLASRLRGVDRKSTRLNSSHQLISYAVFCL